MHSQRSPLAVLVFVFWAGLLGCRSAQVAAERATVISLARHGNYLEADRLAQKLLARRPDDPVARRDARDTRVAVILAEGIELVLEGEPEAGLEFLTAARDLDPENGIVRDWYDKTRVQMAEDALESAAELGGRDHLEEKRETLQRVLDLLPPADSSDRVESVRSLAQSGLEHVQEMIEYCASRSDDAYRDGIHNVVSDKLWSAKRDYSISCEYNHLNESAEVQHERVQGMLSERRLEQAKLLEEQGLHDAARKEYLLVRKADPDNQAAREGLNRTELETRASRLMIRAGLAAGRGEPENAEVLLEEAGSLTVTQSEAVDRMRREMRETRWKQMYDDAVSLEASGRLPEAAAAYGALLGEVEFFDDAQARLKVVQEFIAAAEELYAEFSVATNDTEARATLRRISVFWPTYRDVAQRLLALEAELQ